MFTLPIGSIKLIHRSLASHKFCCWPPDREGAPRQWARSCTADGYSCNLQKNLHYQLHLYSCVAAYRRIRAIAGKQSEVVYEVRREGFTPQILGGDSVHDHSSARGYADVCIAIGGTGAAKWSVHQTFADQLDSLVAPIALYPDPLLAQVLAASTYPLEIVLLQRWLETNKNLKDKQLADAVAKQPWDASVQALAPLPEVVKLLGDNIQWTTDLGNVFLANQSDVMDAVQRMRKKAQDKGALHTTQQQTVETQVIENKSVVVIEPANPEVVYVPSYEPAAVYGEASVSISASLLSAWLLRGGRGACLRRGNPDGSVVGRRLRMGLRLGRWQCLY